MSLLKRLRIRKDVSNFLKEKTQRFTFNFKLFLFGSILKNKKTLNDVDILIVYSLLEKTMIEEIDKLKLDFENYFKTNLDVTILSYNELKETQLLRKIKKYKLIKC